MAESPELTIITQGGVIQNILRKKGAPAVKIVIVDYDEEEFVNDDGDPFGLQIQHSKDQEEWEGFKKQHPFLKIEEY